MIIGSSNIGMESVRNYKSSSRTTARFMVKDYQETMQQESALLGTMVGEGEANVASEKDASEKDASAKEAQKQENAPQSLKEWQNRLGVQGSSRLQLRRANSSIAENLRQVTVRYIFELLFASRKNKLNEWMEKHGISTCENEGESGNTESMLIPEQSQGDAGKGSGNAVGHRAGMLGTNIRVLNYSMEAWQYEKEETSFSTVGTVKTADGREINFNVQVGMSREFEQYYREDLQVASFKMCDPLVINLDTDVASVSDQEIYFDIDADGELDRVSRLNAGSGFLALDKNGDGVIGDGSELFGTASGDGFKDLAAYDEDGNGWIDENDGVWSKLQIWCKDEQGQDVLYRLSEKGVGAICLQKASTDFMLKSGEGMTNGAIRSTGIFLYENGMAGTIQHLDLAKKYYEA